MFQLSGFYCIRVATRVLPKISIFSGYNAIKVSIWVCEGLYEGFKLSSKTSEGAFQFYTGLTRVPWACIALASYRNDARHILCWDGVCVCGTLVILGVL